MTARPSSVISHSGSASSATWGSSASASSAWCGLSPEGHTKPKDANSSRHPRTASTSTCSPPSESVSARSSALWASSRNRSSISRSRSVGSSWTGCAWGSSMPPLWPCSEDLRKPYSPECLEGEISELLLYRVLGTSHYSAPEARQHVLIINTAFGGCAALAHELKLHP